jgi:hypothetical protein
MKQAWDYYGSEGSKFNSWWVHFNQQLMTALFIRFSRSPLVVQFKKQLFTPQPFPFLLFVSIDATLAQRRLANT